MRTAAPCVAFALALGLWTWMLLEPNPVPEAVSARLVGDGRFYAAKATHACAYAFLTGLVLALPGPRRRRWYFVAALALHGAATEVGQTFVPNRTGSVRDVLIDWAGIGATLILWLGLRRKSVIS